MKDPFSIPTILTAQELLDKAFGRATKITVQDTSAFHQKRKTAAARVISAGDVINATLGKYGDAFPSFNSLHPYHRDMTEAALDLDMVKKGLGAIKWAREKTSEISHKAAAQINKTRDASFVERKRSEAFGRISSVLGQIDGDLKTLGKARDILRALPAVDPDMPSVVIAGVPNVGKSALVRMLSTARPSVAQYPFTTKDIHVGYFEEGPYRYQVIDTPGLLDRALEERNTIERKATAALRHLGGLIVFLADPSETCGHKMEEQESLAERIREEFSGSPFLVVETKVDLADSGSKRPKVSGETGQGVEELRGIVVEVLYRDPGSVDRQILKLMEEREEDESL